MDLFNLPLVLCSAASTLAFVAIAQTIGNDSPQITQNDKNKKSQKWKGVGGGGVVEELTDLNLDNYLIEPDLNNDLKNPDLNKPKYNLFINFYSESCGYCKSLQPIWDEFTAKCVGLQTIKVLKCDATYNKNNPKCQSKFEVESFPTIVLYKLDGTKVYYKGERTEVDFCNFLKKELTP